MILQRPFDISDLMEILEPRSEDVSFNLSSIDLNEENEHAFTEEVSGVHNIIDNDFLEQQVNSQSEADEWVTNP